MPIFRYACADTGQEFIVVEGMPLPSECPLHPGGGIKFLGIQER